jgi:hypothetical protein
LCQDRSNIIQLVHQLLLLPLLPAALVWCTTRPVMVVVVVVVGCLSSLFCPCLVVMFSLVHLILQMGSRQRQQ